MDQQQQQQQPGFQIEKDLSMELTEDERQLAFIIKHAVESSEHIKPLPDFEYAYLALACREKNLNGILEVAYKLQCFCELYKLNGTPEEGAALVRDYMELLPGLLLDVSYMPTEKCFATSASMAALIPGRIKTDAQWRKYLGGTYYIMRSMTTDFQSIRNGIVTLDDCDGMSLDNFDYSFYEKLIVEFWSYFPMVSKGSVWLNTPTAANMIYSIAKRFVGNEEVADWSLGSGIDGHEGRLDALFNMPTPEIAQQRLLARIEMFLWQRYRNEQIFTLTL